MNHPIPSMHVSKIKSKRGSKIYHSILVNSSYRDKKGKSQKRTVANLTKLPDIIIELIRYALADKQFVDVNEASILSN